MLTELKLEGFKNFEQAELSLGAFTVLVGTNASGKSNLKDALRFLHGIGRGYTLPEIIGPKFSDGGYQEWAGLRGGLRELFFHDNDTFRIEAIFLFDQKESGSTHISYMLEITLQGQSSDSKRPYIKSEKLTDLDTQEIIFETSPRNSDHFLGLRTPDSSLALNSDFEYRGALITHVPPIHFILNLLNNSSNVTLDDPFNDISLAGVLSLEDIKTTNCLRTFLLSIRFYDLNPNVCREPSLPGQFRIGERGENLSSILQGLCFSPQTKDILLEWIQALTPMDIEDLQFPVDFTEKVLLHLIEPSGFKISAYSASDGTLRFLAMLAILLHPLATKVNFFEEIENGIHPTRLHLLVNLIEQQVKENPQQVITTTHSPQLLNFLSPDSLNCASLVYRLPHSPSGNIKRIVELPDVSDILKEQNLSRLYESGWLEDVVFFLEDNQETYA